MDRVKFHVNGIEHTVGSEVSSNTSLLDYIRNTLELRGTKYMCLEGGCGACIVTASKGHGDVPQSVNSCMVSITSCQDWDIRTIEKIGNRLEGYHPLQTSLAENNGTQCGYCSPGWVMAMYSLLQTKKMTMLEIEKSFGSNVCRCTGYRPILKAFKKFATDAPNPVELPDIEDLKICNKTGDACSKTQCEDSDWCFISKEIYNGTKYIKLCDNRDWYRAGTLDDIFNIWQIKGIESYMLVAGNTGKGAYPIIEYPRLLIDISGLSELKGFQIDQNLVLGAGNTLTEVIGIFTVVGSYEYFSYLNILNDHLNLVAHITVRNMGSIAGNLMLKNLHHDFKSDVFLLMETVGAQLTILTAPGQSEILTMLDFLNENMTGKIILNILLPPLNDSHKIATFKIMPKSQNAHALVHAGFNYKIDEAGLVTDCRIVYGCLSPEFIRAPKTENCLRGKELFKNETLQAALTILNAEFVITEELPDPPEQYRRQIALGLFYKGLLSLCPVRTLNSRYHSGAVKIHETRPVSDGKQVYTTNPEVWPLNKPFPKLDGLIQCAGESKYTEDLPSLPGEVFAAFVLTTVPLGKIEGIDPSEALNKPGVIAFYSASDIPGLNTFVSRSILFPLNEELLCDGDVKFFNQPLGIIVAESQKLAEAAAFLVKVKYSNVRVPVLDIKESITNPAKVSLVRSIEAKTIGNDIFKIITGDNTIYAQYHFCMETLVCVTQPTEQGLEVYSASQYIDTVQQAVSRILNLEQNRIDVFVRRLGGAYGLKISRLTQIAGACSLVAYKLNRPCRFIQSLTHNMRAIGKRLPSTSKFKVAVNSKGEIQYLNRDMYNDNGFIANEDLVTLGVELYDNVYKADTWTHKSFNTVTDTPSNSWCRAPGTLDHIAMTELIMERIGYELNLDPLEVRLTNLDIVKHIGIKEMLDTIIIESNYAERKKSVEKFNSENRWKKRGLRFSFMRWSPSVPLPYFDVNMSVFSRDGTVAITHSGVEMGQGINTKAIQIAAYFLKIPIEKIQIKPNDTMVAPNGQSSGGSITSQNIGIGVQRCCEELLTRLEPIRNQLTNPSWEQLIQTAFDMNVDLQVHSFVNPTDMQKYDIYGITLAEVEIDVLTGEWEILRVDLIEDVGRSVNPELDVGQIEGAFIMGVGYWTTERFVYDRNTGELFTNRTWEYWVPQARDIPQDFRIYFRKLSYSNDIILGSKATGEPATCMGIVVSFSMRAAIAAARLDTGIQPTEWFQIDGPFTVEKICYNCSSKIEDFKFY